MKPVLVLAVCFALATMGASSCGGSEGGAGPPLSSPDCLPAKDALELIGVKATDSAALKTDVPDGPLDLPQNQPNYYVAADTPNGVAVWAMDGEAFNGNGGLVFPANAEAVQASEAGIAADPVEMGIGPGDPDYSDVKDCL